MSSLVLFLLHPTHLLFKDLDGVHREQLIFKRIKIAPGIGKLPVSYEIHNHELGEKGASYWNTIDVASDDVDNIVRLHMGGNMPDQVMIERPPRLVIDISLTSEPFARLQKINWKEDFIQLTLDTKTDECIGGLKLPFDWQAMTGKNVIMPISQYFIEWEERPLLPPKVVDQSTLFHAINRLFRIVFGR